MRERLGELAGQIGRELAHLSFEVLRDFQLLSQRGSLTEEDQSHLERCSFCSQLLATLEPSRRQVEEFATAALAAFSVSDRTASDEANVEPAPKRTPGSRRLTQAAAASFAVVLGAALLLCTPRVSAWQLVARVSPRLAVKLASDKSWHSIESNCTQVSGEESGCAYLTTAARFRADGKTRATNVLLISGLEEAGVTPPIASKVGDTLQTPTSPVPKEHLEAAQVLHAVDMYLAAVDTKQRQRKRFVPDMFEQRP